jgi:hypothetical protein
LAQKAAKVPCREAAQSNEKEQWMTHFPKDLEDSSPKTPISANVYGAVTGQERSFDQYWRGL